MLSHYCGPVCYHIIVDRYVITLVWTGMLSHYPFPTCIRFMMPVAAEQILKTLWQSEKLPKLSNFDSFQDVLNFSNNCLSVMERFHIFVSIFLKSSGADLLYVEK